MSRYIDADEFLENESEAYMRAQVSLAKEHADKTIDPTRYVNEAVHKKIQMLINATESADVVEVVRCKDCEFWNKDENILGGICDEWSDFEDSIIQYTKPDGYCSCGERKEQENE